MNVEGGPPVPPPRVSFLSVLVRTALFWTGLVVALGGVTPLIVYVIVAKAHGDPNPNPIGPGIVAMCTFWPGVIVGLIGFMNAIARHRAANRTGPTPS